MIKRLTKPSRPDLRRPMTKAEIRQGFQLLGLLTDAQRQSHRWPEPDATGERKYATFTRVESRTPKGD